MDKEEEEDRDIGGFGEEYYTVKENAFNFVKLGSFGQRTNALKVIRC